MPKHLCGMICLLGAVLMLAGCKIDESSSAGPQAAVGGPTLAAEQGTNTFGGGAGPNGQFGETFRRLNELAAGTFYLQGTDHPITPEQAATLLPLWQSLQSSMQPAGGANATPGAPPDATPGAPVDTTQISATLDSIEATLTPDQMALINNMTQDDMAAVYQQQGIEFGGFGGTPGNGTPRPDDGTRGPRPDNGTPGAGPNNGTLSPDQVATFQARRGAGGGRGFFGSPLIDAVIKMLQVLAGQ
jgi:hypothetical protein